MLQIYLYQYWTVAETQKKGRSAPRLYTVYICVDLIIINYLYRVKERISETSKALQEADNWSILDKEVRSI